MDLFREEVLPSDLVDVPVYPINGLEGFDLQRYMHPECQPNAVSDPDDGDLIQTCGGLGEHHSLQQTYSMRPPHGVQAWGGLDEHHSLQQTYGMRQPHGVQAWGDLDEHPSLQQTYGMGPPHGIQAWGDLDEHPSLQQTYGMGPPHGVQAWGDLDEHPSLQQTYGMGPPHGVQALDGLDEHHSLQQTYDHGSLALIGASSGYNPESRSQQPFQDCSRRSTSQRESSHMMTGVPTSYPHRDFLSDQIVPPNFLGTPEFDTEEMQSYKSAMKWSTPAGEPHQMMLATGGKGKALKPSGFKTSKKQVKAGAKKRTGDALHPLPGACHDDVSCIPQEITIPSASIAPMLPQSVYGEAQSYVQGEASLFPRHADQYGLLAEANAGETRFPPHCNVGYSTDSECFRGNDDLSQKPHASWMHNGDVMPQALGMNPFGLSGISFSTAHEQMTSFSDLNETARASTNELPFTPPSMLYSLPSENPSIEPNQSSMSSKKHQKKRSRLQKTDYNNMSPEEKEARKKYLNMISAREYRQRESQIFNTVKGVFQAEQERHADLKAREERLESSIKVLTSSIEKMKFTSNRSDESESE